jgi:hypothetical protein
MSLIPYALLGLCPLQTRINSTSNYIEYIAFGIVCGYGFAVFGIEFDRVCALRNTINTKLETASLNGYAEAKPARNETQYQARWAKPR